MKSLVKIVSVVLISFMAVSCCNCANDENCCKEKKECCKGKKECCKDKKGPGCRKGHKGDCPDFMKEKMAMDAQWAKFDSLSLDEQQALINKQKEFSKKAVEFRAQCQKDGKCGKGPKGPRPDGQCPNGPRPDEEAPMAQDAPAAPNE